MKQIKSFFDFILKYWALLGIFGTLIGFFYKNTYGIINQIDHRLQEIKQIAIANQQMTLRNTIWNDSIPVEDRMSACDLYLSLGYNSYTKKKCEVILDSEYSKIEEE